MITKRTNISYRILEDYHENGLVAGNEKPEYKGVEDREMKVSNLAEAGDCLETYLLYVKQSGESDTEMEKALFSIDLKITELRGSHLPLMLNDGGGEVK